MTVSVSQKFDESQRPVGLEDPCWTTSYRRDVSRWGGLTHFEPDTQPRELMPESGTMGGAVSRAVDEVSRCMPIRTPKSTYQAHYRPYIDLDYNPKTTQTNKRPLEADLPEALASRDVRAMSTEYRDEYVPKCADDCVTAKTRGAFATTTAREIGADERFARPKWTTTYRAEISKPIMPAAMSPAVTFSNTTGLR